MYRGRGNANENGNGNAVPDAKRSSRRGKVADALIAGILADFSRSEPRRSAYRERGRYSERRATSQRR